MDGGGGEASEVLEQKLSEAAAGRDDRRDGLCNWIVTGGVRLACKIRFSDCCLRLNFLVLAASRHLPLSPLVAVAEVRLVFACVALRASCQRVSP